MKPPVAIQANGNKPQTNRKMTEESENRNNLKEPSNDRARKNSENLIDPLCNPASPKIIHFEDVTSAAFKIKNGVRNTPCGRSQLSELCGMEIYLKKDFLQVTGR